jgi:hypothetical protein
LCVSIDHNNAHDSQALTSGDANAASPDATGSDDRAPQDFVARCIAVKKRFFVAV